MNTTITLRIEITEQQMNRLPTNISHFLELAALERLGEYITKGCEVDYGSKYVEKGDDF